MSDARVPGDLAARFVAAHRSHEPVAARDIGTGPQTVDDAYAVQAAVMQALGSAGGFKTSRPDPDAPNVMAPIPAHAIRLSPANYSAAEMHHYGIELEIAFRIDQELPALEDADYDARLRGAVSAVAAIEMVDTRLADRDGASDLVKLADNNSGFGLVAGQPVKDFAGLNLVDPAITFTVDGKQLGPTSGRVPGNADAFQVLKDFLAVVGAHCGGVAPGMYVTTGALSGLFWTTKDVTVRGSIAGLGDVEATIGG